MKRPGTIKFKAMVERLQAKEAARVEVKRLWAEMCSFDEIPPDASFVVFSNDNPFEAQYNKAMAEYVIM